MSNESTYDLSTEGLAWLGELGERLEDAWEAGLGPKIEDYLAGAGSRRDALLHHLIGVEWDVRGRRGEAPAVADYVPRFPDDEALVRDACRRDEGEHSPTPPFDTNYGARFRILGHHREGGLGVIHRALDQEFDRVVAVKTLQPRLCRFAPFRARLHVEAELTGRLDHPSIVSVYARGRLGDGEPFYAMRFIPDRDLRDLIADHHRSADRRRADPRTPPLLQLLRCFVAACRAVDYAHHRGVMHRDLKPANIMVQNRYDATLVVDWGLARPFDARTATTPSGLIRPSPVVGGGAWRTGPGAGTLQYMSPEQAAGDPGPLSDVFSLGATLYEILTGRTPYPGKDDVVGGEPGLIELVRECRFDRQRLVEHRVPRALGAVCLKAMAPKPADRYPTPGGLADEVQNWLDDLPVGAWKERPLDRLGRWARRHRPLAVGLVSALVFASVSSVLYAELRTQGARADAETARADTQTARADFESARADADKARAEANFGLARSSVFELIRLVQNADLPRVPQASVLEKGVASLVATSAEILLTKRPNDPDLKLEAARSYRMTANLFRLSGDTEGALKHYARSEALLVGLPGDFRRGEPTVALTSVISDKGEALRMAGRYKEALEAQHAARRLLDTGLLVKYPDDNRVLMTDALVLLNLGSLASDTGHPDDAQSSFGGAVRRLRSLQGRDRISPQVPKLLALALVNQAEALRRNQAPGDAEKVLPEILGNLSTLESGTAPDPAPDPDLTLILALAYHERGRCRVATPAGRESAAGDYDEAVRRLDRLCADFPQRATYRTHLAEALTSRGCLFVARDRPDEAGKDLRRSLELLNRSMSEASGPNVAAAATRRELARTLDALARLARGQGDEGKGRGLSERAVAEQERLAKDTGGDREGAEDFRLAIP
jgi:serine/threonine protein kinase